MVIRSTGCCGVQELQYISSHPTPQEVLKDLCDRMRKPAKTTAEQHYALSGKPHGHYIFTGVIRHRKGEGAPTQDGKYGPNLMAYIRQHNLGTVVESAEGPNRVNHPTHIIKVWVWTPAPRMLQAWYEANYGKRSKTAERPSV